MAYTLTDRTGGCQPLRLIVPDATGEPVVKVAFWPHWWVCDPCNPSAARYEVMYREGQPTPTTFAWYEVVTTEDTDHDVDVKVDHYRRVLASRAAMDDASREYRRLTGCGWSVTPSH
ncbi:MAG TPA: hypothetical protein VNW90_19125 [Acetobacteraceae bacterium]|jgi:hypothetical protein|nr:hypothetical protein [Acetobacteraceae bacterium]